MTTLEKTLIIAVVALSIVLITLGIHTNSISTSLDDSLRQDSISQSTIQNLYYSMDTIMVNLEIEKEKRTALEKNYNILSTDYRKLTNEEHHLNIISAPDTLNKEWLFRIAAKYKGQLKHRVE